MFRRWALTVGTTVVVVAVLMLSGVADGVGGVAPSSGVGPASTTCTPSFVVDAYSSSMVTSVGTTLKNYLRTSDVVDLVSGNSNLTISPQSLTSWRSILGSELTGTHAVKYAAHTAGLANINAFFNSTYVLSEKSGTWQYVVYDYEPDFEPEFSWNQTNTTKLFLSLHDAITYAHSKDHHQVSYAIAYPTGRPLLGTNITGGQFVTWNYGAILKGSDVHGMWVQTQKYANLAANWTKAQNDLTTELQQYSLGGDLDHTVLMQVSLGSGSSNVVNATIAEKDISALCNSKMTKPLVYLWWTPSYISLLEAVMAHYGR